MTTSGKTFHLLRAAANGERSELQQIPPIHIQSGHIWVTWIYRSFLFGFTSW